MLLLPFVLVLVFVLVIANPGWYCPGRHWRGSPPGELSAAARTRGMPGNTISSTSTAALNTSTSTRRGEGEGRGARETVSA
jgi:hypothetical protein